MKLRVIAIILLLSLFLFFGLEKIYANKYNDQNKNLGQLKILKYLPEDSKLLFISNFDSSNIFRCSIFVLCSLFFLTETFLKPKKSNNDNNRIIATILSFIINVYFYF